MLLRGGPSLNPQEKKVLLLFRSLSGEQQQTVSAFLEFLSGRTEKKPDPKPTEPLAIPRPEQESVVKAIKRLRATYPMLDQNKLFNETSQHMTEHVLHGKPAAQVIDQLEAMFLQHFERYRKELEGADGGV